MPEAPSLAFIGEARVTVGSPIDVGDGPAGRRRVVPIVGGTIEGPKLRGRVLPGADWQILRTDGVAEIEARYLLETTNGGLITVVNRGLRRAAPEVLARLNDGQKVDPSLVYFRTVATFETAVPELAWLTQSIILGTGARHPAVVVIQFWIVE